MTGWPRSPASIAVASFALAAAVGCGPHFTSQRPAARPAHARGSTPAAPAELAPTLALPPEAGEDEGGAFELTFAAPAGELTSLPSLVTLVFSRPVVSLLGSAASATPVASVAVRGGAPVTGRWYWFGTRTAVFVPSPPLPHASEVEVVIPGSLRALDGAALGADRALAFSTPRPSLRLAGTLEHLAEDGGHLVGCEFNQPVDAAELRRAVTLRGRRGRVAVKIPFTLEPKLSTTHELVLPPSASDVGEVVLEVAAELRGDEGPLVAGAPARVPLPELGPLTFRLECERAPDGRCAAESYPWLELSKSVPTLALYQRLRFEPPVPQDRYEFAGSTTSIPLASLFDLAPGGEYRVELAPGLVTDDGERVTRGHRFELSMADETPRVSLSRDAELLIERTRPSPFLRVWGVNVPAAEVVLAPLPDARSFGFVGARDARALLDIARLPGARAFTLPLGGAPNESAHGDLPLPPELLPAGGVGSFAVASSGAGLPPQAHLVTVTDLGVQTRWSARGGFVWVTRLSDAAPVVGAVVELEARDAAGRPSNRQRFSTTTDARGLARVPGDALAALRDDSERSRPLITVRHVADRVVVRPELPPWDAFAPLPYVFVERGIYQPGERVHVKGYVRVPGARGLETPVNETATILVRDTDERVLFERVVRTDDYGSFAVEGRLPDTAALGYATIDVTLGRAPAPARGSRRGFLISRYRVLDFEVKAALDREAYVRGDTATLAVSGRYLHGAPMRDVPVSVTLETSRTSFEPDGYPGYHFGYPLDRTSTGGETVATARLDARGRATVRRSLGTLRLGGPARVRLTANVEDVGGHFALGDDAEALVHPAGFYLGLKLDSIHPRYPGRAIEIEVLAATPEGAPQVGAEVNVALELDPAFTGGDESDGNDTAAPPPPTAQERCRFLTGAAPSRCRLTPPREGHYLIAATSKDARGNPVATSLVLEVLPAAVAEWRPPMAPEPEPVAAPDPHGRRPAESFAAWCQRQPPSEYLAVSSERSRWSDGPWKVGETAEFCVLAPAAGPAFMTLEREPILKHGLTSLAAGGNLHRVRITDALYPESTLAITQALPARHLPGPSGEALAELVVDRERKTLAVTLEAPERARPGGKARLRVKVARGGKPTAAQVTLWAVDEGVLALQAYQLPAPLELYAERFSQGVVSHDDRTHLYRPGPHHFARAPTVRMGATHVGAPGPVPVREEFEAVAFYLPDLRLDGSGRATLELPLPDNATRWRVFAVAATRDDAFGGAEATITTSQPLLVRPRLPRSSRVGDRFRAAVVLDSTAKHAIDVELTVTAQGALAGYGRHRVSLPARGHREVELPLVARHTGTATLTFSAREVRSGAAAKLGAAGLLRDEVKLQHRVALPTSLEAAVVEGTSDDIAWERLGSLAAARADVGSLEVRLANSPLVGLGEAARALESYPYGCTEQLVASLVPSLVLHDAGRALGLESSLSRQVVEGALGELLSHQQKDGGFGFWAGSEASHPWLTGFALLGLGRARAAGFAVDERALRAATRYLEQRPRDGDTTLLDRVWLEDALASGGRPRREHIAELAARAAELPIFGRALLAHAAAAAGDAPLGRRLLDGPVTSAIELTAATGRVRVATPSTYDSYLGSTTRDTALVVRALGAAWPAHPALPRLVQGLLAARQRGRYATTQDGAFALMALDELREQTPAAKALTGRLWLDDEAVFTALLSGPGPSVARSSVSIARLLAAPRGALGFASEGGVLHYQAILRTAPRVPPDHPQDHGLGIEREAARATYDGGTEPPSRRFTVGDWVALTAMVTTPVPREQVVIVLPLAAGLEAVDPALATTAKLALPAIVPSYRLGHVARHDDRVELFVEHLPAGTSVFTELARATIAGTYGVPPAMAECMYAPDVRGATGGETVVVVSGG